MCAECLCHDGVRHCCHLFYWAPNETKKHTVKFVEIDGVFFSRKIFDCSGPRDSEIQRGCLFLKIRCVMREEGGGRGGGREGGREGGRGGGREVNEMRHDTRDRDNASTCGGRDMRREGNPAFKLNLMASRVVCGLGSCKARVCGISLMQYPQGYYRALCVRALISICCPPVWSVSAAGAQLARAAPAVSG
jgi:hypothetical protein